MLNEGLIVNDTTALVKSQIVDQIRKIGPVTPDGLEQAVFKALVGHSREEVDWEDEGNQAGYYTWVKAFDGLINELIEDGFIFVTEQGTLAPTEADAISEYSHLVYPPK